MQLCLGHIIHNDLVVVVTAL